MHDHPNPPFRPVVAPRRRLDPLVAVLLGCMAGIILTLGLWIAVASGAPAPDTAAPAVEVDRTAPEAKPEPEETPSAEVEDDPDQEAPPVESAGEGEVDDEVDGGREVENETETVEAPVEEVHDEHERDDDHQHDHDHGHDHVMEDVEDWLNQPPKAWAPVVGDELDLRFVEPEHVEPMLEIWNRFVQLIPADQRTMVTAFELAAGEGTGAYVYPDLFDRGVWTLGVSTGLDPDLDLFLVHEFAHLLTLNAEVTTPAWGAEDCPATYFLGDACTVDGSMLDEFVDRFWEAADVAIITELYTNGEWDEIDAFYLENADEFVSGYAATNPMEDLAESFMVFVLYERPLTEIDGGEKIEWFYEDAEMVALRDEILAQL